MKKKYLIVGLFSIIFGIGYSFGDYKFYHSPDLGLISIVSGSTTILTLQDKDLGATCSDVNADCSRGNLYQFGNNYGFSSTILPNSFSDNIIYLSNYLNSSFNSNGVFYKNIFFNTGSYFTGLVWSSYPSLFGDYWGSNFINSPCPSGFDISYSSDYIDDNIVVSGSILDYFLMRSGYNYLVDTGFISASDFGGGIRYYWAFATTYNTHAYVYEFYGSTFNVFQADSVNNSVGLPIRCFKNSVVNPDSSWILLNSPCNNLNGKTGTISIIETDTGTYYTLTLGDGTACTLPRDFGLSGGAIQIQNNNTWSGTITIVDDSYITYTDLSGNTILITTGYDVNKGTWENILTAFSGHQLTIYETDSGTYYTFVDSNGQIKTADVNGVFQYLNQQLQFTGLQTGSYNMMTANRWYGQMLDKGRHLFQCGVDYGTKNVFSVRVSDYYYSAKVVEKLDTNLLGFMLCPFYSLLAGISDNFDNSTMMRSGYKPVLAHTGYFDFGSSVNRGKFYSFFDASLIFVIFITYGSIFYFIIRKF